MEILVLGAVAEETVEKKGDKEKEAEEGGGKVEGGRKVEEAEEEKNRGEAK